MTRMYRVEFFKKLADSTGHEVETCQGSVEVSAPNRSRAIDAARQKFAELGQVSVWSLRADYERVEPLNAPASETPAKEQGRHTKPAAKRGGAT